MASQYDVAPLDLARLRNFPLSRLPAKVNVRQFARPLQEGLSITRFLETLPGLLAGQALRELIAAVLKAHRHRRTILWGIGGHVIKVGLAPVLIDLLRRGCLSGLAMNGAALIHDVEIALAGKTSENVEARLGEGRFGMAEETGRFYGEMAREAAREGIGLGEAAGKLLTHRWKARFPAESLLIAAYRARIPVTVHVAIGTDTVHLHRSVDGGSLGQATLLDFRLFCALVRRLHPGGVYLNWGSAVLLPEVFLKAVSAVRNLGVSLRSLTTANFDFLQSYRALENVVRRPTRSPGSRGYAITGHHEIMLPLVAAALAEGGLSAGRRR